VAARHRGRPPSRRPELEQFTARLSRQQKTRLKALAQLRDEPAYLILAAAFRTYWEELPASEREAADTIAAAVERIRRSRGA